MFFLFLIKKLKKKKQGLNIFSIISTYLSLMQFKIEIHSK